MNPIQEAMGDLELLEDTEGITDPERQRVLGLLAVAAAI